MTKSKLTLSIISFCLTLILLVGGVFAWFSSEGGKNRELFVYSGTSDVVMELFLGIDDDFDGVFNTTEEDISTRAGVLANQYLPLNDVLSSHINPSDPLQEGYFSDIYAGKQLSYKMVMQNEGERDVSVDISFGSMQDSFYNALNSCLADPSHSLVSSAMMDYYSENSARLLFSISGFSSTVYASDIGVTNSLTEGFSTVVTSFAEPTERGLWQFSAEQSFIGQKINDGQTIQRENLVIVPTGCLIEINFALSCTQNSIIIGQYLSAAKDYTQNGLYYQNFIQLYPQAASDYDAELIKSTISAIVDAEQSFIYSSENEGSAFFTGKMEFEVPFIKIRGTLLPNVG